MLSSRHCNDWSGYAAPNSADRSSCAAVIELSVDHLHEHYNMYRISRGSVHPKKAGARHGEQDS
jgi:hypothetical protein